MESASFEFFLASVCFDAIERWHVGSKRQQQVPDACLFEVRVNLLQLVNLCELNHFVVTFALEGRAVNALFANQIDGGFDGVPPVSLDIAPHRCRVRWSVFKVRSFLLRDGMPGEELAQVLDVFVHILIHGDCNVRDVHRCCRSRDLRTFVGCEVGPELDCDVAGLDDEHAFLSRAHEVLGIALAEVDRALGRQGVEL